jgi:hypothetical protein
MLEIKGIVIFSGSNNIPRPTLINGENECDGGHFAKKDGEDIFPLFRCTGRWSVFTKKPVLCSIISNVYAAIE